MSGESLGVGEAGFVERIATDSVLRDLVGTDDAGEPKIYHGWPSELLEADEFADYDFPRVTYFRVSSQRATKAAGDLRLQVNIWVVDDKEALEAIDSRIVELVDEQWWTHDGARISGRAVGGEFDMPAAPPRPSTRRRELLIGVR